MYSFIIINYGTPELVENLLLSLEVNANTSKINDVIIVDNGFPDKGDTSKLIDTSNYSFCVKFIKNTQHSYSSGVNAGVTNCTSKYVVVSNSDVEILKGEDPFKLVNFLVQNEKVNIVAPQQLYADGNWQRSYGDIPSIKSCIKSIFLIDSIHNFLMPKLYKLINKPKTLSKNQYLDGAFLVFRKSNFTNLDGFDESFPFYAEETDFCYRSNKNGKLVHLPNVKIMHLRGGSTSDDKQQIQACKLQKANKLFVEKHFTKKVKLYLLLIKYSMINRIIIFTLLNKLIPNKFEQVKRNVLINYRVLLKENNNL